MTSMPAGDLGASAQPIDRVAIVGTGLIGTSVALAATRAGVAVTGWDAEPAVAARAAASGGLTAAGSIQEAVRGADLVVICTPIPESPARSHRPSRWPPAPS